MTDKKRACVFCGATPVTREHNPPDWLNEYAVGVGVEFSSHNQDGLRFEAQHRKLSHVVKLACKQCNTGWMSELEGVTKPILGPMTKGTATKLPENSQIVLATWLAKTALVSAAEGDWERAKTFRPAFEQIYKHTVPNEHFAVFVGPRGPRDPFYAARINMGTAQMLPDDPGISLNVQNELFSWTVAIGHFVGVVVYRDYYFRHVLLLPSLPPMQMIWPSVGAIVWPLRPYLSNQGVRRLQADSLQTCRAPHV